VLGLTPADHEARTALAQLTAEIGQALEQKLGPRAGRMAPVQQAVVEAEDRDDALVALKRGAQRRVIADPQVASKPDDPDGVGGQVSLATRMTSFAGASKTSSRRKSSAIEV
jgi:hypothetical protein